MATTTWTTRLFGPGSVSAAAMVSITAVETSWCRCPTWLSGLANVMPSCSRNGGAVSFIRAATFAR